MKDDISIRAEGTEEDVENLPPTETGQADAQTGETGPEAPVSGERSGGPRRYRLYDRFADHVSLRTIDAVILITAVLIIALLIYGIITGNPQA